MIYTVRTTSGREQIVIDLLSSKVKAEGLDIKAIFHPAEIKGYIFLEGTLGNVQKAIQGLMHVKGVIEKPVQLAEIQRFLEYKKERIQVNVDDIVEIIGGPFKGEKGKVSRVDKVKSEVTVELLEATIPIPVTITTEFIKIIKAAKAPAKPEEEEAAPEESKKSVFDIDEDEEEPAKEEPKQEAPTEEAPTEEKKEEPAPEEPKEETPEEPAPTEEAPAEEPKPEEPAPDEPKEEAPAEPAPVEETPAEPTPEEPKPEEPTPAEETPAEEDAPVDDLLSELGDVKKKKKDDEDE
jgi:transcriptional antiterminator NusG